MRCEEVSRSVKEAVAVGTGGDLTKGAKTGDYDLVEKIAKEFVYAHRKAEENR
ncbi:hypothetical protein [Clostridium chromiireducens]|uniref:Keto-hydroxyglutarate-aldolase/keto-deoxy-phosphogluconate aldolase n=1 Tax=Clostridium chromiireducens TaxID=225345 RepID=A0A1V4IEZ0_9CLOT|nr:keto-hydroxyglutarate-aldolase/keto-deoxy-phosphogluconate aldolase [Clostridium chromiireducens]